MATFTLQTLSNTYIDGNLFTTFNKYGPVIPPLIISAVFYNLTGNVDINWIDMSSDETGFEILRSDTENGEYSLIGTVAANTEEFIDDNI